MEASYCLVKARHILEQNNGSELFQILSNYLRVVILWQELC